MVNQLTIAFERGRIMLSPYDEILHKQLIDYEIERISQSGLPVFSSENEHFIDALGLAYLAFVLEFPTLTQAIKEIESTSKMSYVAGGFQANRAQIDLAKMSMSTAKVKNPWDNTINDPRELRGDRQEYFKVPLGAPLGFYKGGSGGKSNGWGSRGGKTRSGNTRSSW